jgi:2',3'-cyclic-nucleotide 2'-phosphodiesterase (5'-nucleotidase family)
MLQSPKTILKLLCLLFALGMSYSVCFSEEVTLTIVHSNDTYGQLLPLSEEGVEWGGVLHRAHVIHEIRKENPDNVIVVDAGDSIGSDPTAAFDQGETVIQMMNKMGYDAMTLGNHEFDYGVEILRKRAAEAQFAMLSANTLMKDTGKPLTQASLRMEVGGVKVGIIGLTAPETRFTALPRHHKSVKFGDPRAAASDAVKELKEQGCDLIILLSHMGNPGDMALRTQVDGINLIVGGGGRTSSPKSISAITPVDEAVGTTLVYSPWLGRYIGRVDVRLEKQEDGSHIIKGVEIRKYRLDKETYPDEVVFASVPELKTSLDDFLTKYQKVYSEVLGHVTEGEEINPRELIPLVIREKTKVEVVLLNRGSVRPGVFKGEIQRGQVAMDILRHPNQIVTLELTGDQLRAAVGRSNRHVIDNRKLILLGLDPGGNTVNGRGINSKEYYTVATNDFLEQGGDDYGMVASGRKKKFTGLMVRQVIIDYIQAAQAAGQPVSIAPLKAAGPRLVVKSKVGFEPLLKGLVVSETAEEYGHIRFLQTRKVGNFAHWGIRSDFSTLIASPKYNLELNLRAKYGRLHHPDLEKSIELDDDAKVAALLKLLAGKWGIKPIARLEFENIEMTLEAEDKERRIISQLSAGLERGLFRGLVMTSGANFRRHQPEDEIQHQGNADIRAKYETRIKGFEIKSEAKLFLIVINTALEENEPFKDYIATISGSAKLPLNRFLFLSASAVLYRESRKGPWAHNANIAIQFRQTWGKKG